MTVDIRSQDAKLIRQLIPLSTLHLFQFEFLCKAITVEEAKADTFLFKRNDTNDDLIYLLSGSVSLQSDELMIEGIKAGSESALFALAHQLPRKIDAYTNSTVRIVRISLELLGNLPEPPKEGGNIDMLLDQSEEEEDDDGMTALINSPIFRTLSPAFLQKIIMGIETSRFKKGEVIIEQNEQGQYFYFIKKGRCMIFRSSTTGSKPVRLGRLGHHETFGEDSLVSDEVSHTSVKALTDITLFKLKKENFISYVKEPLLDFITHTQLKETLDDSAMLIDIRTPGEYKPDHLEGSENIPFFLLRIQLNKLDKKKTVVIICANGKKSESAAILLLSHEFTVLIVEGGMEKQPAGVAKSKAPKDCKEDNLIKPDPVKIKKPAKNLRSADRHDKKHTQKRKYQTSSSAVATNEPINKSNKEDTNKEQNAEILRLKQLIQELIDERDEETRKYRVLFRQAEKLKTELNKEREKNKKN